MPILSALVTALAEAVITRGSKKFSALLNGDSQSLAAIATALGNHMASVATWSSQLQMFGMEAPVDTVAKTLPLKFTTGLRRFRAHGTDTYKSERDLLSDTNHVLILGPTGSGKTTTLKRLAQTLLTDEASSDDDEFQFPLVIRLRELPAGTQLVEVVADAIGIRYDRHIVERTDDRGNIIRKTELRVGEKLLRHVMPDYLNATGALLLLDGFDEVVGGSRAELQATIVDWGRQLTTSKIVLTTRTGEYTSTFEGFALFEISPLDEIQVDEIAQAWLKEPTAFIKRLVQLPYRDVIDRPLLLAELILIYDRHGDLPEQPTEVYKQLVVLLLEDWDRRWGVKRRSRYGAFTPSRKLEFLAALAYHLTYKIRTTVFSTRNLEDSYLNIYKLFKLPPSEGKDVVAELETHTGLIAPGRPGFYEFSHLSIQEYLCANYLVREPFAPLTWRYMHDYPEPLAVAVALSSNPSNWFANLVLQQSTRSGWPNPGIAAFLSRIEIERPIFTDSDLLGLAFLRLFTDLRGAEPRKAGAALDSLAHWPAAVASIALALARYKVRQRPSEEDDHISLVARTDNQGETLYPAFDAIVPLAVFRRIIQECGMPQAWLHDGKLMSGRW